MEIKEEYYEAIKNDDLDKLLQLRKINPTYTYISNIGQGLLKSLYLYNSSRSLEFFLEHSSEEDINFIENTFSISILDDFILVNRNDNIKYITKLLDKKANPNGNLFANGFPLNTVFHILSKIKLESNNNNILMNPEYIRNKEIIKILLSYGANPNLVLPSLCQTVLDRCDIYDLKDISSLLLKYNAIRSRSLIKLEDYENNGILDYIQLYVGQILNIEYNYNQCKDITLRTAIINNDKNLKLIFTNGLYKSREKCELLFAIDSYIPIHQELINSKSPYNFFSNILFNISTKIHKGIKLQEGIIFDKENTKDIVFPNDIDGLMLIDYIFSDNPISEEKNMVTLWLLVPFKYPKSGKFSPSNLKKFIERNKTAKWKKVAYWLETNDDTGEYIEIYP